ncbi:MULTISPECIES: hypothetical protein [Nonomuraea]|uniref:Uncharacterized protein n=1 Tax=Nonomuraea mangrovi TaxID=2316207 RepID=A0ABW4THY8_9ACTN
MKLSYDELTLTAELLFKGRKSTPTKCQEVTGTELVESPARVTIGVQVKDTCRPWPWEEKSTLDIGYMHQVQFKLKKPLAGRTVVDVDGQRIKVLPSPNQTSH